jgi:uncharacterized protein DUF5658
VLPIEERGIRALVLVNLVLQLYDGLATYVGLHAGFAEGNPILVWALGQLGPASALFLFKLQACLCLLAIWLARRSWITAPALALCAAIYIVCSLAPWTAALADLHLEKYAAS